MLNPQPERIGAAINVAASLTTTALRRFDPNYFAPAEIVTFLIDTADLAQEHGLAVVTPLTARRICGSRS